MMELLVHRNQTQWMTSVISNEAPQQDHSNISEHVRNAELQATLITIKLIMCL